MKDNSEFKEIFCFFHQKAGLGEGRLEERLGRRLGSVSRIGLVNKPCILQRITPFFSKIPLKIFSFTIYN